MFLKENGQMQSEVPQTYLVNSKKKKNKRPKKYKILRKIIKTFFITLLIMFILLIIAGGYAAYKIYNIAKDAKISTDELVIKYENSVIKDMQGNTLGVLNGNENRESITLR